MFTRARRNLVNGRYSIEYSLLSSGSTSSSSSGCSSPELSPEFDDQAGGVGDSLCQGCSDSLKCNKCWSIISLPSAISPLNAKSTSSLDFPRLDKLRRKIHKLCSHILSFGPCTRVLVTVLAAAVILLFVLTARLSDEYLSRIRILSRIALNECSWNVPKSEQLASFPARKATFAPSTPYPEQVVGLKKLWATLQANSDFNRPYPLNGIQRHNNEEGVRDISAAKLDSSTYLHENDATASRLAFANFTHHIPTYPRDLYTGQGIVMIVGGRYSSYAAMALGSLRLTNTTLPVEMWMPDRSEDAKNWCDELPANGARCRFFTDYMPASLFSGDDAQFSHGYQYKVLAMILSSFEEILLLDTDNHALANIDGVFEAKTYKEHRSILWPDYWTHSGSLWLPYIVGLSNEKSTMLVGNPTTESGQLLWDKRQRWRSLATAVYLNYYGPTHFYTLITQSYPGWGDKDTFDVALRACNESSYSISQPVRTAFFESDGVGMAMLQADPHDEMGRPMFMHVNIDKMSVDGMLDRDSHFGASVLNSARAIRPREPINDMGVDPEPNLWKVAQHTACWSPAYGDRDACLKLRKHRALTYNVTIPPHRAETEPRWICEIGQPVAVKQQNISGPE